jgi:hypothetical protein
MSPHRKRDGRYLCVEVFSQELEELRQEPFKNGENHKLGDVKTPLDYTLSVCICLPFVFLSTQFYCIIWSVFYSIVIVCFCFVFCIFGWDHHVYLFWEKATGGLVWFDLDALKDLGLRYGSWLLR